MRAISWLLPLFHPATQRGIAAGIPRDYDHGIMVNVAKGEAGFLDSYRGVRRIDIAEFERS
jgi:hypothetical protein